MEEPEMRHVVRRSGAGSRLRLLSLFSIVGIVAACGAGASAASPVGGGAGGVTVPAASAAPGLPQGPADGGGDTTGGGGGGGGTGGGTGNQVADLGAKIIRTGSLQITVSDVGVATRTARDTIRGFGGYVGGSDESRNGDELVATISYRVPADRWEEALDAVRKLGTVVGEKTNAQEVTSQLIDLDARIRNLKASETALVGYAEKAPKISDLLEIEARLTDTRGEIERLSAQQAQLTDQVALATLTVTFGTEVVAVTQAAQRWDPAAEVDRASATLISAVQALISILIVIVIVWLPLLAGAGLIVVAAWAGARRLGWIGSPGSAPPAGPPSVAPPTAAGD
jgi:hypothetical protein